MKVGKLVLAFGLAGLALGCSRQEDSVAQVNAASSSFVSKTEPSGAMPVGAARTEAKNDSEIVLVGHIGGSEKPFIDGIAAFTIVDPKVPYCATDEGCPTPWDYCCTQNDVKDNIAMVKLVDAEGNPVSGDAKTLLGVKELSLVVVQGKAQRDDAGNLTLLTEKVFVKN